MSNCISMFPMARGRCEGASPCVPWSCCSQVFPKPALMFSWHVSQEKIISKDYSTWQLWPHLPCSLTPIDALGIASCQIQGWSDFVLHFHLPKMSTCKCFRVCCSSEIMQHYKEINILNKNSTNVSETSHSSDSQSRLQLQSVHLEAASPCNLRGTPKLELIIYYHPWVATAKDYPNTHAGEKNHIYIYTHTWLWPNVAFANCAASSPSSWGFWQSSVLVPNKLSSVLTSPWQVLLVSCNLVGWNTCIYTGK